MKQRFAILALVALVLGLCVPPVFAQATGSVKGVCKDATGKPITDGTVEWLSQDTGRKYTLKLNKKGEYFSLGVAPGKYKVTLFDHDGKELFHYGGVPVSLDEVTQDIDLQKEQAAQAAGQGMSAEQLKAQQEQQAKAQKENMTVKSLNEKLAAAKTASDAGDFDTAISTLSEATQEFRFFGPVREITKSMLVRYLHIDYDREIAIVAIKGQKKKAQMLGVARLTKESAGSAEGEFAILVRDEYQGKGVGTQLMDALIQAARDQHIREINGDVLAANAGMLGFAESLGFDVRPSEDPEIRKIVLRV